MLAGQEDKPRSAPRYVTEEVSMIRAQIWKITLAIVLLGAASLVLKNELGLF